MIIVSARPGKEVEIIQSRHYAPKGGARAIEYQNNVKIDDNETILTGIVDEIPIDLRASLPVRYNLPRTAK